MRQFNPTTASAKDTKPALSYSQTELVGRYAKESVSHATPTKIVPIKAPRFPAASADRARWITGALLGTLTCVALIVAPPALTTALAVLGVVLAISAAAGFGAGFVLSIGAYVGAGGGSDSPDEERAAALADKVQLVSSTVGGVFSAGVCISSGFAGFLATNLALSGGLGSALAVGTTLTGGLLLAPKVAARRSKRAHARALKSSTPLGNVALNTLEHLSKLHARAERALETIEGEAAALALRRSNELVRAEVIVSLAHAQERAAAASAAHRAELHPIAHQAWEELNAHHLAVGELLDSLRATVADLESEAAERKAYAARIQVVEVELAAAQERTELENRLELGAISRPVDSLLESARTTRELGLSRKQAWAELRTSVNEHEARIQECSS